MSRPTTWKRTLAVVTWGIVVAYVLALGYQVLEGGPTAAMAVDLLFVVVWVVLGGRYLAENERTPTVVAVAGLLILGGVVAGYAAFAPNPVIEQATAELPIYVGLALYFYGYVTERRS